MLKLVKMEHKYAPQLFEMMDEWSAAKEKIIPWAIRKCDYHDLEKYIDGLDVLEGDETHVPDSTFFCLDTERNIFVGAVNIRHYLNEKLLHDGGYIGDGIRPSERGKGYGTQMIALALQECDRLGIRRVLMCGSVKSYAQKSKQAAKEKSRYAMEESPRATSRCFMFMYFLLPH